jgi:hypothetical protein
MGIAARQPAALPEMALDRAANGLDDLGCILYLERFAVLVIAFAQGCIEVIVRIVRM